MNVEAAPIFDTISAIQPLLINRSKIHVILACLTIAANSIDSTLTGDELHEVVTTTLNDLSKRIYGRQSAEG